MSEQLEVKSVGQIASDMKVKAFKTLAGFCGILVYLAMIGYTLAHNFTLMTVGIPQDMFLWAVLGVAALEITAIALPIALHYWTHEPLQRIVALLFYILDLAIVFINVVLDFAITAGEAIPSWGQSWLFYIVPSVPIIAGVGWSALFMLDPSQKKLHRREQVREAISEAQDNQLLIAMQRDVAIEATRLSGMREANSMLLGQTGFDPDKIIIDAETVPEDNPNPTRPVRSRSRKSTQP